MRRWLPSFPFFLFFCIEKTKIDKGILMLIITYFNQLSTFLIFKKGSRRHSRNSATQVASVMWNPVLPHEMR